MRAGSWQKHITPAFVPLLVLASLSVSEKPTALFLSLLSGENQRDRGRFLAEATAKVPLFFGFFVIFNKKLLTGFSTDLLTKNFLLDITF